MCFVFSEKQRYFYCKLFIYILLNKKKYFIMFCCSKILFTFVKII